jgi:hypothetical protein
LAEAIEADLYRRVSLLRQLGDTSLMVGGFFSEAVRSRPVGLSYYHQMGETAYAQLGQISESNNVFDELSSTFVSLTEVLNQIFNSIRYEGMSVESLLDEYQKEESEILLKKLKELGVVPIKVQNESKE